MVRRRFLFGLMTEFTSRRFINRIDMQTDAANGYLWSLITTPILSLPENPYSRVSYRNARGHFP